MPIFRYCGLSFIFPAFKCVHVCKGFKYSNCSFGEMISQVSVYFMKSVMIIMENISEVDVLNAAPLREAMGFF